MATWLLWNVTSELSRAEGSSAVAAKTTIRSIVGGWKRIFELFKAEAIPLLATLASWAIALATAI